MKQHRRTHYVPNGSAQEGERKRVKRERNDMGVLTRTKSVSKNVNHVEIMYWLAHLGAYAVAIACVNTAITVKNILKNCSLLQVIEFAKNV